MARKVFMSVLGTGFYGKCKYQIGDFISKETRFIQQATLEMLFDSENWTDNDAIYFLLTDKAKDLNWNTYASGKRKNFKDVEDSYTGLEEELDNAGIKAQKVDIKDGNTEEDLWDNFSKIYDLLQEGDELYFDITHGFRYLPMFVLVLMNYAKFLKHIKVKLVSYGNYESRNQQGIAPLMDLTTLVKLQEWTNAAADYMQYGDVKGLNDIGKEKTIKLILKEKKGKDETAKDLQFLFNALEKFSNEISFCRGLDIIKGEAAQRIKEYTKAIAPNYLRPFSPFFDKFANNVSNFKAQSIDNMYYSAKLCVSYGKYQSATTLLREWVLSSICSKIKKNFEDKDIREKISTILQQNREKNNLSQEQLEKLFPECQNFKVNKVANAYSEIANARNDFNHAGIRKGFFNSRTLQDKVEKAIGSLSFLCSKEEKSPCNPKKESIFINLSNHPYSQWSEEQLEAAKNYGECVDLPFPQIDPMSNDEDIEKLVDEYTNKIFEIGQGKNVTVHVMGEMSFTFAIITRLKEVGIRCVCSTSYRLVKDEGNGKRYVEFIFKKFRNYGTTAD